MPFRSFAARSPAATRLAALCCSTRPLGRGLQSSRSLFVGYESTRARSFHATPRRRDAEIDGATNHYEALKLAPGATAAEIKKSFYALSKTHHPDHNRSDPNASQRFMRISEAYTTLSSPDKRSKYDRDVLGLSRSSASSRHARRGSYSSSSASPAGGRPASGLSRRRGTFTGPPPSFYRQGGWGAHSDKRRAAHDDSTGGAEASSSSSDSSRPHETGPANTGSWDWGHPSAAGMGGMGPGQDPYGHHDDVPHFDAASHEKTGRAVAARRARRARKAAATGDREAVFEGERGPVAMFLIITGVIAISIVGPVLLSQAFSARREERDSRKVWDKAVKG